MSEETKDTDGIEFMDRYSATGTPYPEPGTVCPGQCDGMGVYPHSVGGADETDHERAEVARITAEEGEAADGWYFIRCGECGGTGKRPTDAASAA